MSTPSSTRTTFMPLEPQKPLEFDSIKLKLASPDIIHKWSHGEVQNPETINYRTQKPEKDGLFCEKIFGPSKDWECYCGKYKKIRYKGIICDKCGVEVTRSIVRRERLGHIDLAAPVSHIWFLRGIPSKIGLVLNLSVQELEKVIYYANFIITHVDEDARKQTLEQIETELKSKRKQIESECEQKISSAQGRKSKLLQDGKDPEIVEKTTEEEIINLRGQKLERLKNLEEAGEIAMKEVRNMHISQIISESSYQDLSLKYGHVFEASIGGEAIRILLKKTSLKILSKELDKEVINCIPSKKKKLIRRSRLIKSLLNNNIKPEWMVLKVLPVIPPDLRPMVQLDGGRFATSDLNDLYRRVINRNNRLKRLQELKAPEVIQRNEKRMLQEAVDALIDNNARHGKTVTASTGQKRMLKSIADLLKGKQGRFRQNLLGKRVDYSGRSVIVAGPHLKLGQCGLPKQIALELYRPFVISKLIGRDLVHNVRSANRYIDEGHIEVWDILEEITKNTHVLLNRAPTLHRLGIQAFQPILIEGKAIQLHPLVCTAFNADFDGDQMAVHLPITSAAKKEASELMAANKNLLKPATGEPITTPSQDIVWGAYYLTKLKDLSKDTKPKYYCDINEAEVAYKLGYIGLQDQITIKLDDQSIIITSVGRIILNSILPKRLGFINETLDSRALKKIVADVISHESKEETVTLLDNLKDIAFKHITRSGISWSIADVPELADKPKLIAEGEDTVEKIREQYNNGLLTDHERYIKVIEAWTEIKNRITEISKDAFGKENPIVDIVESGARGSWAQMIQIMGIKGLVTNPAGEIIELPVKANFIDGLDVLEYFISTHGTRKGLSDTALRTANAGYLTRRLVDVAQDLVVIDKDCKDTEGLMIELEESEEMNETIGSRSVGRYLVSDIKDKKGKIIVKKTEVIDQELAKKIDKGQPLSAHIRSVITCRSIRGVCQKCYGHELGHNQVVEQGTAVGIIAAQSIGEPGTQLTMRTFHTGGVAGADITQGLPRVEELFEARPPKKKSIISPLHGQIVIENENLASNKSRLLKIKNTKVTTEEIQFDPEDDKLKVKNKDVVKRNQILLIKAAEEVRSNFSGTLAIKNNTITITGEKNEIVEVVIPAGYNLWVKNGELVLPGQQLTEGSVDLHELYRLQGKLAVQKYIIKEIQYIYSSQGQNLNDKHIELIARQMFSRVYVKDAGDTELLPGEIVTHTQLQVANAATTGDKAKGEYLLMGITKASLASDSWLSSASFQETARVLIDAAITGKVDRLQGLKENVIIGKLIPAGTGYNK